MEEGEQTQDSIRRLTARSYSARSESSAPDETPRRVAKARRSRASRDDNTSLNSRSEDSEDDEPSGKPYFLFTGYGIVILR